VGAPALALPRVQVLAPALDRLLAQNAEPVNLLSNADFERGEDGWSVPCERADFWFVAGPVAGQKALKLDVNPEPGADP
jgi:hypothetical protein